MSRHEAPAVVPVKYFSRGTKVLFAIALAGIAAYIYRLTCGDWRRHQSR